MGLLSRDVFVGVGDAQSLQLSVLAVDAVFRLGRDLSVLLSLVFFDLVLKVFDFCVFLLDGPEDDGPDYFQFSLRLIDADLELADDLEDEFCKIFVFVHFLVVLKLGSKELAVALLAVSHLGFQFGFFLTLFVESFGEKNFLCFEGSDFCLKTVDVDCLFVAVVWQKGLISLDFFVFLLKLDVFQTRFLIFGLQLFVPLPQMFNCFLLLFIFVGNQLFFFEQLFVGSLQLYIVVLNLFYPFVHGRAVYF